MHDEWLLTCGKWVIRNRKHLQATNVKFWNIKDGLDCKLNRIKYDHSMILIRCIWTQASEYKLFV